MKIAVSESLKDTGYPVAERHGKDAYDVTIVLAVDARRWHENSFKKLRPHFVESREQALEALAEYEILFNGRHKSKHRGRPRRPVGDKGD